MHRIVYFVIIAALLTLIWGCNPSVGPSTGVSKIPPSAQADQIDLFDFDSEAAVSQWRSVNDTVMGGVSNSRLVATDSGSGLFNGTVSLDNNGGFASVRSPSMTQTIEDFAGIAVRIRGDGKRYKVGLRTDKKFDGVFHQASFTSKNGDWLVVKIPFSDFIPTYHGRRLSDDKRMKPQDIQSVSFLIADKQQGRFQLEIDWIKAYR